MLYFQGCPRLSIKRKKLSCFFILLLLSICSLKAQTKKITIDFENCNLETALTKLITDLNVPLSFNPALLPPDKKVSKKFIDATVNEILDYLLSETELSYNVSNNEFIIIKDKNKPIVLSGHFKDLETREDIIGAALYTAGLNKGVATNSYGYYALAIPKGNYTFLISHIGYKKKTIFLSLKNSKIVDIMLEKQTDTLKEVTIQSPDGYSDTLLSGIPGKSLSTTFIQKHPALGGEADIIKIVRMQSGVVGGTEGSNSLFIRGGGNDQNLILMDEAPVYNPAHLFGLVSIFNQDAISNVQLYKDEMPANFGGRLSSIIDVSMLEGDKQNFHIKGGASFLSARLAAEGPLKRDQGSFLLTFRRGLTDFINNNFQLFNLKATYYDLNTKFNYTIDANNRVFLSAYYGVDHLLSSNTYRNSWGNKTATLRWNHLFNSRVFSNLSAIYSNYNNQLNIDASKADRRFNWITGIEDFTLKEDFTFYYKPESNIKLGFNGTLHKFIPGESPDRAGDSIPVNNLRVNALDLAVYISHNLFIGPKFQANYGLRAGMFKNIPEDELFRNTGNQNSGSQNSQNSSAITFVNFEPRLFLQFKLNKTQQLHAAYNRNYQYMQLVQDNELSFSSLETWIPSSTYIAPQKADIFSLGYKVRFNNLTMSADGYYKKLSNQLDLIDHAQIILNHSVEHQLRVGKSDAYGTEINIIKNWNKFNGILGYSYTRVYKQIAGINNNNPYPPDYDVPHNFKLSSSYQFTSRLSLNSFFIYRTGKPVTLPVGYYTEGGRMIPIFEDRNSSRFSDYNRLDLSLELKPSVIKNNNRHWQSTWLFAIYNVYNKKNPLFYTIDKTSSANNIGSGIVPSITYNFKF